jgi:hypothetical protein
MKILFNMKTHLFILLRMKMEHHSNNDVALDVAIIELLLTCTVLMENQERLNMLGIFARHFKILLESIEKHSTPNPFGTLPTNTQRNLMVRLILLYPLFQTMQSQIPMELVMEIARTLFQIACQHLVHNAGELASYLYIILHMLLSPNYIPSNDALDTFQKNELQVI